MKPKSYLALDWDDINELEKTAKGLVESDTNDVDWHRGSVILYVIEWMRQNNIYTRPFKTETNEKEKTDILKEVIDKMFEISGHPLKYEDVAGREDNWFQQYTMTEAQNKEWREWGTDFIKKKCRYKKELASREMAMIDLYIGLKVIQEMKTMKYKLIRERDKLIKESNIITWVEWNDDSTFKQTHDEPAIGRSLLLDGNILNFTWCTTTIKEIVEMSENYIKFETKKFNIRTVYKQITMAKGIQPEISDEEIEKAALEWCLGFDEKGYNNTGDDYSNHELPAFIAACKWYRDQVKNK